MTTNAFKTASKRAIEKIAKATGNFIKNKIANKTVCRPNPESKETTKKILKKERRRQLIINLD